jgi:hypothetical protein
MKEKFQFKSIRSRLTFWFTIIAILPLIAVGVIIYNNMVDWGITLTKIERLRILDFGLGNNLNEDRTILDFGLRNNINEAKPQG